LYPGYEICEEYEEYLEIQSNGVRLAGSAVFWSHLGYPYTLAMPLQSETQTRMLFSQIASNANYFTGLNLMNPNRAAVSATIEVFSESGTLIASKVEVIGSGMRRSRLLTQYFPELGNTDINAGYIKVTSELGLTGNAVLGSTDLSVMSTIPAQVVP
jgi:hypothetical protein